MESTVRVLKSFDQNCRSLSTATVPMTSCAVHIGLSQRKRLCKRPLEVVAHILYTFLEMVSGELAGFRTRADGTRADGSTRLQEDRLPDPQVPDSKGETSVLPEGLQHVKPAGPET
ncbi:hypothetical protein EYF80_049716 [Liparis tanakae]|uniref:Uncharacterized protein n=1 Tax=Liparis tanakae TaxID=230148 RepID=A0A4Z2FIJ8_9TELE|nr:hypothetical protein EYF80_049716 [Liparis tanakae]